MKSLTDSKRNRLLLALLLILLLLAAPSLASGWQRNRLSLQAMHAILEDRGLARAYASLGASDHPRRDWYQSLIAGRLDNPQLQRLHWSAYLHSGAPEASALVYAASQADPALVLLAAAYAADRHETWYWLGEALVQGGFDAQAIIAYQRALQLDPADGLAWCRLARLLYPQDPLVAREAFLRCCFNGDPGSNGCFNVARIEEERGDIANAIIFYRLSRNGEIRQRADDLEAKVSVSP